MARNIPRLIAALERDIEIIEQSIAAEEVATRQSDRTRMDYSLVARSLIARRDNLVATKLALNSRLGTSVDETRHAGFSTVVETQAYA